MKNLLLIMLTLFVSSQVVTAQYYTKEQAFEYEVLKRGRADVSLKEIKLEYKNAKMQESGGRVISSIGAVMLPIGLLAEMTSTVSAISLTGNKNKSDTGKGIMGIGLVITGIGLVTWTMGTRKKNKIMDRYFEERYGYNPRLEKPIGTISTTRKGVLFKYTF